MNKVILKFSGEALKDGTNNVSSDNLKILLDTIKILQSNNKKVAIVLGGGNFFRGRDNTSMDRVNADSIGILYTIINSIFVKDYLEANGLKVILTTPFDFKKLIPTYTNQELNNFYEEGFIIIFGGGVGLSGYSSDSGITIANNILNADMVIKMTNVDGVYDKDPDIYSDAKMYKKVSYDEVINKEIGVMDLYAVENCKEKHTQIKIFNVKDYEKILDDIGTIIGD